MENILYYLLKVSIGIAVFYLTWYFCLKNNKHFVFNRIYLTGTFLISFILPLITFTTRTYIPATVPYISGDASGISESVIYLTETGSSISFYNYLIKLYFAGAILFLLKLAYAFTVAIRIKSNSNVENISRMKVWVSNENIGAFTFFNKIVIGKNILSHPSLYMVLIHESIHAREKHYYDILISELLFILQWFNPFAWKLREAIKINLEFRADAMVVRDHDTREYQLAMLSMIKNRRQSSLFSGLNSSNLKKRITMMNPGSKNRFSGIAKLIVIPVIAILTLSLSGKKTVFVHESVPFSGEVQSADTTFKAFVEKLFSNIEVMELLMQQIQYPQEAYESGIMGRVRLYAIVGEDGIIREVTEKQPDVDEGEIQKFSGYRLAFTIQKTLTESSNHEILTEEVRNAILSMPVLDIPKLKGKVIQYNYRFDLRDISEKEIRREERHAAEEMLPAEITYPRHDNELANLDEVYKYLQHYIKYPEADAKAGNIGKVELYLRISRYGWPAEVYEQAPKSSYIEIKDPVSISYRKQNDVTESSEHGGLIHEGKMLLMSMPRLDITELHGQILKLNFNFMLQ
jgi:hypothetical protein